MPRPVLMVIGVAARLSSSTGVMTVPPTLIDPRPAGALMVKLPGTGPADSARVLSVRLSAPSVSGMLTPGPGGTSAAACKPSSSRPPSKVRSGSTTAAPNSKASGTTSSKMRNKRTKLLPSPPSPPATPAAGASIASSIAPSPSSAWMTRSTVASPRAASSGVGRVVSESSTLIATVSLGCTSSSWPSLVASSTWPPLRVMTTSPSCSTSPALSTRSSPLALRAKASPVTATTVAMGWVVAIGALP